MHVVIAYDISSSKRRQRVFKILKEFGVHSQRSVFECDLTTDDIRKLVRSIEHLIDVDDSLIACPLCRRCASEVRILGQGIPLVRKGWEVI